MMLHHFHARIIREQCDDKVYEKDKCRMIIIVILLSHHEWDYTTSTFQSVFLHVIFKKLLKSTQRKNHPHSNSSKSGWVDHC